MRNKRSPWDWVELGVVAVVVLYLILRFDEQAQDGWLTSVLIALLGLLTVKILRLLLSR